MINTTLESHDFTDTMGLMSDTGCPAIDKRLNRHICFKGGGGGQTTEQVSTIPDEWKPYIERSLASAEGSFNEGEFGKVAGFTDAQKEAIARQKNSADQYSDVASDYDATRSRLRDTQGLKDASAAQAKEALAGGQTQAALGGSLGSARQQALQGQQENALTRDFADLDYKAEQDYLGTAGGAQQFIDQGTNALGEAGKTEQGQIQAAGDAQYQSLNRLFGLYGSAPFQSQQTIQKGGGGK